MSKLETIWNWFIGIFLTLTNLFLIFVYGITGKCSVYQGVSAIFFFIFGIFKISEMIYYTTNKNE